MNLEECISNYYNRPSVYKTSWDEYCRLHPDNGFNKPVAEQVLTFVTYNLRYNTGA